MIEVLLVGVGDLVFSDLVNFIKKPIGGGEYNEYGYNEPASEH